MREKYQETAREIPRAFTLQNDESYERGMHQISAIRQSGDRIHVLPGENTIHRTWECSNSGFTHIFIFVQCATRAVVIYLRI